VSAVTVTPTIMDGTVVRWYAHERDLDHYQPAVSASRDGVMGHDTFITPELFDAAWAAHLAIKIGADVSHLATHRKRGLMGAYEHIEPLVAAAETHGSDGQR
jgi:hypothetical protein